MTIPFKPSLLTMASVLALSACISGGGDAPAVKSSETPSNKVAPPPTDTGNPATGADTASPAPGQGGNVETPSSGQNGSSVPTPPGAGGSSGSESTTPSDHNHHEGGSSGSESTTPSDHNHHEGDSAGSESTTPAEDSGSQGGASTHPANPEPSAPAALPLETGELGEKYFYGEGEITNLVINGETIDLTVVNEQLSRKTKLWTDFDKIITSKDVENLIYGAAKLADGSYALFVQGKLSGSLPGGTATYKGDVLHFRSRNLTEGENWFDAGSSYRKTGSFIAEVNFADNSLSGKINSGDGAFMGIQEFKGSLNGSRFTGTWKGGEKGSISGGFYGDNAAKMAGRYSYVKDEPEKAGKYTTNNSFGVFGGEKVQ
ncbi:transferrin-binding protein-like solute binding protein [Neisseria meningitidis]